ncbi:5-dehydro-2-deoxygluconokinase [Sulfobacillus acidophilus]|uniref:5-dehydro-2-deoxygluconokinase n=1 Tax=Sulfobacillus acidophilus TaxID=53633 RepID=A0ABS3AW40_9FIRM|nr:5-dehydro-2-deoxygluconokinase [Sulfobacillus acidophilus]
MGRVGVDLYAEQIGSSLKDAETFRKHLGGCAGNIAVGCARLGLKSALLSRVGSDEMGVFLRETLKRENVDVSLLKTDNEHLTALVLLGVNPPDRFPLIFYRESCADNQIKKQDIAENIFQKSKAFLLTGTCLAKEKLRDVSKYAISIAKKANCLNILDIDYRPVLWGLVKKGNGEQRYKKDDFVTRIFGEILPQMDLIIGTKEEFLIAGGSNCLKEALKNIKNKTNAILVLKKGSKGCEIYSKTLKKPISHKSFSVEVLNVLGAGDAFLSGFLKGFLQNDPMEVCAKYGNANGAIVVSRHGCSPAMATFSELNYFINNYANENSVLSSPEMLKFQRQKLLGEPGQHELFILAFDHRTQFKDSLGNAKNSFEKIASFKNKVYQGFEIAKKNLNFSGMSILLDPIYGKNVLKTAQDKNINIGMPIEEAGSYPLGWISDLPLYKEVLSRPKNSFVKVLVHFHVGMDPKIIAIQLEKLTELNKVCNNLNRKLMIELLMPSAYRHSGNNVARAIDWFYGHDIAPFWWKITAMDSQEEWQEVTNVIDENDPSSKIVILGKGANLSEFNKWFLVATSSHHCIGFAVGRSIFWQCWQRLLKGEMEEKDVPHEVAKNYLELIRLWHKNKLSNKGLKNESTHNSQASWV